MHMEPMRAGWGLFVRWIFASTVGLIVGLAVYVPILVGFGSELSFAVQSLISAIAGAIFGASLGIAQGIVLRRRPFQPGRWVLVSIVGGSVGGAVALSMGEAVGDASSFELAVTVGFTVIGAFVGIAQWIVLRRQLPRAGWWILAGSMGTAGTMAAALAARETVGVSAALALIIYGAITGSVLLWLLRQSAAIEKHDKYRLPAPEQSPTSD
jgi:hypothetical protein